MHMPELPEVETIAAGLRRNLPGLIIRDIALHDPQLLRGSGAAALKNLRRREITNVRRRGKMLLISCRGPIHLLFHLKMTGQFYWAFKDTPRDRHTRLSLRFADSARELRFRDVRKFGSLRCLQTRRPLNSSELRRLGPEPLELGRRQFLDLIHRRKGRLKSLLLDQNFVAGIGNIYADEILFRARFHPLAPASRLSDKRTSALWRAIRQVLTNAIAAGGSSIRDYRDSDGIEGRFQTRHRVYGRKGLPCPRCGVKIRRIIVGGRSSFFCPRCQRRK
jgi:formamidopyrimidine-DNA glycosylase